MTFTKINVNPLINSTLRISNLQPFRRTFTFLLLFVVYTLSLSAQQGEALCFQHHSNDHVNLGNLGGALDGVQKFTIEAWLNPNDPDAIGGVFPGIFSKRAGGNGFALYIQASGSSNPGAVTVLWLGSINAGGITSTLLPPFTWTHVAFVFDGTQANVADKMKFYFDGVLQPSTFFLDANTVTTFPTNSHDAMIGTLESSSNHSWLGCLDEVRIWNEALSASTISAQKDICLSGSESGLIAYYQFDEGIAGGNNAGVTNLPDMTSNGNDGSLSSSFALSGTISNWNAPGGMLCTSSCPDDDNDGVCNDDDNCPSIANAGQEDADSDGLGDVCDDDDDNDGCLDVDDANPLTASTDSDGDGDADDCDVCPNDADNDIDGDGVCGDVDNCPTTANSDQADADGDDEGDVCDVCPYDPDNDADGDGVCGDVDNCPADANPHQKDLDADGLGDACDATVSVCDALDALADYVESLNLPNNTKNFLLSKLDKASDKFQSGNNNAAIGNLTAFINKVNAKTPSQISQSEADALIATANAIINAINNGNTNCTNSQNLIIQDGPVIASTSAETIGLRLFPNPADNKVNIQLDGMEGIANLAIYDQFGRIVWSQQLEKGQLFFKIDLSGSKFVNGIYFVHATSEGQRLTQRLVIAK